jgi:hypothetical protein
MPVHGRSRPAKPWQTLVSIDAGFAAISVFLRLSTRFDASSIDLSRWFLHLEGADCKGNGRLLHLLTEGVRDDTAVAGDNGREQRS